MTEYTSDFHCSVVHKPIAIQDAMLIPDAMCVVDKTWDIVRDLRAWDFASLISKSEAVQQSWEKRNICEFRILMDLCHLEAPSMRNISKHTREIHVPGGQRKKRQWIQGSFHGARSFSFENWQQQDSWIQFPDSLEKPTTRCQLTRRYICRKFQDNCDCQRTSARKCSRRPKQWDSVAESGSP